MPAFSGCAANSACVARSGDAARTSACATQLLTVASVSNAHPSRGRQRASGSRLLLLLRWREIRRRLRHRRAVLARVGRAPVHAGGGVVHHRLAAAHVAGEIAQHASVAWPRAVSASRTASGNAALDGDVAAAESLLREARRFQAPSGCSSRDPRCCETNCACACAWFSPPMMPKPMCTSPFSMKAGMMVWNGRLRGASALGCSASIANSAAAILQGETVIVHHHAGAEMLVEALNQRDDVAVAIHHGEIDGVAADSGRRCPARYRAIGAGAVDQAGAFAGVIHGEHAGHRHLAEARVGDVAVQVGIGQFLRLDLRRAVRRRRAGCNRRAETAPGCSASRARRCPVRWAAARRPSSRGIRWRSAPPIPPGTPPGRRQCSLPPRRSLVLRMALAMAPR